MIGKVGVFTWHILFITLSLSSDIRAADDVISALQQCRKIETAGERLGCFDEKAKQFAPPTITGKLGHVTDVFALAQPHLLRYRSHGVIFVLYLRDGEGNVLQNLHIGGTGEDEYFISTPGKYSLKIDGSAAWDIWLQPMDDPVDLQK